MGFLRWDASQLIGVPALMNRAEDHRRRAQRFLELAQNISDPQRRVKAIDLAIKWMVRAREASQPASPVVQQQQQIQPEKKLAT